MPSKCGAAHIDTTINPSSGRCHRDMDLFINTRALYFSSTFGIDADRFLGGDLAARSVLSHSYRTD